MENSYKKLQWTPEKLQDWPLSQTGGGSVSREIVKADNGSFTQDGCMYSLWDTL